MKKILLGFAAATFFASATSSAFAAEKVAIGVPSWTGAQAIAHLISVVVTDRIGGEVDLVPGNNATIFQAMDRANF